MMTEEGKGRFLVALATVGFGSMAILGKIAFAAGANVPTLLSIRFSIGAGVLWGLLFLEKKSFRVEPRTALWLLFLGVLGYGGVTGAFFTGLQQIPAALASMLFFTYPVYLAVITALWGREGLSRRQAFALGLALTGVFLTLGPVYQ